MRGLAPTVFLFGLWVAGVTLGGFSGIVSVHAQEQFFTQSGGRGLQNAKTNARLTKNESDIGVIQEDLKTIQPHARAQLGNCGNTGEKLRYDGRNWICEKETDPTVKGFAKKDLPTCSGTSILGVSAGELSCVESGFVSNETDPTVQPYAKAPLPSCGIDQVLSVSNGALGCQADQKGLTTEIDPKVHNFARKDVVSALPNCGTNELLTMNGGLLACKVDSVGIVQETDPLVQPFARTDNGQPALAACATGEILKATTVDSQVILVCESVSGALTNAFALNDLSDVNTSAAASGTVLTYSGSEWQALPGIGTSGNPLNLSQLNDVTLSSLATNQLLRWDGSRWINRTDRVGDTQTDTAWCRHTGGQVVCDRPAPLTCTGNESLRWDGGSNTWVCTDLVSGVVGNIALDTLSDVTITTPGIGQSLRYTGSGWANSAIERILAGDTQVVATDTGTDGLLSFATDNITRMAITNEGRVGVGVMPASPYYLDVSGSARVMGSLTVTGDLNISGSQSIDGVIFANGGIEMPGTLTSGNISVTNLSATIADIRTLRVTDDQTVGGNAAFGGNVTIAGNLSVSGSQSLDGVLFANGGIQMPGTLTSSNVSATNISGTVADIRTLRVTNNQLVDGGVSVTGGLLVDNGSLFVDAIANRVGVGTINPGATLDVAGTISATDLRLSGNLYVSGSQSIDGVVFANGGIEMTGALNGEFISATNISASGNISANQFIGDGSLLSNLPVQTPDWYSLTNIPAQITAVSESGAITLSGISATNASITTNLTVGGSLTAGSAGFGPIAATGLTVTGKSVQAAISATNISASGNISANQFFGAFVGDGSGLTNINPANITGLSLDRISSTNNQAMVVATQGGTVSFTLGGTPSAAYLHSSLGLVASGVSTTGTISGVTVYASRFMGGTSETIFGGTLSGLTNTGDNIVGLGFNAAYQNTGIYVVGIGRNAARINTGDDAVGVGRGAAQSNTGDNVVGLGFNAAAENTRDYVIGLGFSAAYQNSGTNIVGVGRNAARQNTGLDVVGVGRGAAQENTGDNAVAIGYNAAYQNTSENVVGVGYNAASQNTGSNVIGIGRGAANLNTGNYLVAIGYNAGYQNTLSNQFIVQQSLVNATPLLQGDFASNRLGIGLTTPSSSLHIAGTLRINNGAEDCDANRAGGIRYNSSTFEFCNGGGTWQGLAAVAAAGAQAAGIVGSVQYKGAANEISGSANYTVTNAASRADVAISGTLKVAGSGTESCSSASHYGQMRFIESGGQMVMEVCRP